MARVKLHYYPETDSLYIELLEKPGVKTLEIRAGLNADLDGNDQVVGFDIDHLSEFIADNPLRESRSWGQFANWPVDSERVIPVEILRPYTHAFENAVMTPVVQQQLQDFSRFQTPDAAPIRLVSLTLDDPAPLVEAEHNVTASL